MRASAQATRTASPPCSASPGGSGHAGGHRRRGGGGGFGLVARRTRRQAQRRGQRDSQHMAERAQDAAGMGRGREQLPKFGIGGEPVLQLRAMARHLRPEPEHPAKPGGQALELRRGEQAECRSAGCRSLGLLGNRPRAGHRGRTLIGVGRGPGRDQAASAEGRHHGEEPGGEAAHPLQRRSDQTQIRPGLRPARRDGPAQPPQNQGEHLGEAGGENSAGSRSTEYLPTGSGLGWSNLFCNQARSFKRNIFPVIYLTLQVAIVCIEPRDRPADDKELGVTPGMIDAGL